MGRIHRHAPGLRVGPKQAPVPVAQVLGELVGVLGGDGEERLVLAERIGMELARHVVVGRLRDPSGPLGDASVGIAVALRSQPGELSAEPSGLLGRNLSVPSSGGNADQARKKERRARMLFRCRSHG